MRDKKTYDQEYFKANLKRIYLALHKEKDSDILDYLAKQNNVQGALKQLIRKEIGSPSVVVHLDGTETEIHDIRSVLFLGHTLTIFADRKYDFPLDEIQSIQIKKGGD